MRYLSTEILRPWKLFTLAVGLVLLIVGSFYYKISDWDIGISIVMGVLTYLTAPWSVRILLQRQYRFWPLAIFFWYFSVDGSYWLYHTFFGNQMIRDWNLYTSTPLYFIMGCFWLYQGSLYELYLNVRNTFKK